MSSSDPNTKQKFISGYTKTTHDRYASRNADTCAGYLLPVLASLPPNFTFLDIGCGPGSITCDLASRFPNATFVGVDPGEPFLTSANERAQEKGIPNVEFRLADFDALAADKVPRVEAGTWDVVHCHQVLLHIRDQLGALKTMKRYAKAEGGVVAAREGGVHASFHPKIEGTEKSMDMFIKVMEANGSDPAFGPKLLETCLKAGWKRDQITAGASSWCYTNPDEKKMWVTGISGQLHEGTELGKRVLEMGTSKEELATWVDAWKEWERSEAAFHAAITAEVVCRNT